MKNLPCEHEKCTGCSSCENACPRNAINMIMDLKGFLYPEINQEKCVQCGICDRVCPYSDNSKQEHIKYNTTTDIYGLKNKDENIRRKSSSGGTFYLLAENTIRKEGSVYGCILDEKLQPVFTRAENIEDCLPMMGSKYVQSNLGHIFKSVKKDLISGKKVLFTGMPCQCQGLRYYLSVNNTNTDNLIIVDFLCHGAPAPVTFEDLKQRIESKYKGKIKTFYFRDKERVKNPPSSRGMRSFLIPDITNKKEIMNDSKKFKMLDVYDYKINVQHFELFKRNYLSRECCFDCKYIGYERRAGDITFGDFWGCEKNYPDFFDRGGISLVLLNTEKGFCEFENIKENAFTIEVMKDKCIQTPLVSAPKKPCDYNQFWDSYYKDGYIASAQKYTRRYIFESRISSIKGKIKRTVKKIVRSN